MIACEIVVLAATQGETSVANVRGENVYKSTNHQFLGSMLVLGGVYFTPPSLTCSPPEKWCLEDDPFLLGRPIFRGYIC